MAKRSHRRQRHQEPEATFRLVGWRDYESPSAFLLDFERHWDEDVVCCDERLPVGWGREAMECYRAVEGSGVLGAIARACLSPVFVHGDPTVGRVGHFALFVKMVKMTASGAQTHEEFRSAWEEHFGPYPLPEG